MKKRISFVAAILFVLPVCLLAQGFAVDQGVIILGGTAGYTMQSGDLYENQDGDGITSISINPLVGYFVIPNLAVGAELLYQSDSQGDFSGSILGIGPQVAYFIGDANSSMYPFVGASYVYGKTGGDYPEGTATAIVIGAGVVKMVAKNVGISAQFSYMMESQKPEGADEATKGTTIMIGLGVNSFIF